MLCMVKFSAQYDSLALECCVLCIRPKNRVIHYDQPDISRATENIENGDKNTVVFVIVSYCKGNFLYQKIVSNH